MRDKGESTSKSPVMRRKKFMCKIIESQKRQPNLHTRSMRSVMPTAFESRFHLSMTKHKIFLSQLPLCTYLTNSILSSEFKMLSPHQTLTNITT